MQALAARETRRAAFPFLVGVAVALGIEQLQPLAEACVLGLIAAAVVGLWRAPRLAERPERMASLMAAILIGLQLSAEYWAFLDVARVVPLVGFSLLSHPADSAAIGEVSPSGRGRRLAAGVQSRVGRLNSSGVPVDHLA